MKILHVITSLSTGGAEKLLVDLLPRLRDYKDEVEICVFDGTETPFMSALKEAGIKVHCLTHSPYSLMNIIKLFPFVNKYDVVHTHNTSCQFAVAILKPFTNAKLVTTEHSTSNRRRGYKFMLPIDRWMYRRYDRIVCVSKKAGQNIKDYVSDHSLPIVFIANGIDTSRFYNADPCMPFVEQFDDIFKVVMVAGFRYEKDHETAIRAFALLSDDFHLFLVGDGEKKGECEALVSSLGIIERVHFLGIRTDVPNILKASDVVIMSSHREGLSLSNLEGMACGKPFIASDVDGLHEIVNGYGILFPHKDSSALAAAIMKVRNDKEFAKTISDLCQIRARMYDISIMAEKYHNVYLQIID